MWRVLKHIYSFFSVWCFFVCRIYESSHVFISYLFESFLQINWSYLSRAQDVLKFVARQVRFILLLSYGPDTRALLIAALDENMLESKYKT